MYVSCARESCVLTVIKMVMVVIVTKGDDDGRVKRIKEKRRNAKN